ncbi:MAG: GNAT family N-acetyltransferase [Pacificimonas sp.]|jgi:GNAT superfamily N-acetyltransferase|nr:GNAT family N-acetyltransferase [Pacificimonas sp.]
MTIRLARANELEACRAVEAASGAVFKDTPYPQVADAEPNAIEVYRAAYVDKLLWVAEDRAGGIAGQLTAAEGPKGLLIAQIDVMPDAQGQGLGKALIAACEAEARERSLPFLWLRTFRDIPWNAPFYARLGFEITEGGVWGDPDTDVRAHEVASGLDPDARVTMVKRLS